MGTRDSRTISEDSVCFSHRQGEHSGARKNRAELRPRGRREQGDPPLSPPVDCALGVLGKGCSSEGRRQQIGRGATGDLAGSPWVDYVAKKARRAWGEYGGRVPAAIPLWRP